MRRFTFLPLLLVACVSVPTAEPPAAPPTPEQRAAAFDAWNLRIRRFLADERPGLRRCYDDELRRVEEAAVAGAYRKGEPVPSLAGSLVLAIPVGVDGAVVEPRLDDDALKNENVASCLLARARAWRFEPPPDGEPVELALPFEFSLMGPDAN